MPISRFFLFKRSNGFWYIVYDDDGRLRWKTTGCHLKSDALARITEFEQVLRDRTKSKSLSYFTEEFLGYARFNYAKGTVEIFERSLKHLLRYVGDRSLKCLTLQHLDRYKTERQKEASPTSVNIELRGLRAVMNVALRWRFLESNPFSKVQLMRVPQVTPSFLSKEDFQKLISVIKEEWFRELVIFAVLTGMRRAEILNLRWQHIDLDRRLLQLESNANFNTKSGKIRTVPLNDVAVRVLTAKIGRSTCEHVFHLSEKRVSASFVSHKFKKYVRKAGLVDSLKFHSLRHTFATWLVQDGVSIFEVQKLLGHSSVAVTQVYSHLAASELHKTVNKISVNLN